MEEEKKERKINSWELTREHFPGYQWESPVFKGVKRSMGTPPKVLSATGDKYSRWVYGAELFAGLRWYWATIEWPTDKEQARLEADGVETTVTFLELCLDFQAATHLDLEGEGATAKRRARLFIDASERMAQLCKVKPAERG